jgi:excisionase family DNA binding protein
MRQRLRDWYRFLEQQMQVSLSDALVDSPPHPDVRTVQPPDGDGDGGPYVLASGGSPGPVSIDRSPGLRVTPPGQFASGRSERVSAVRAPRVAPGAARSPDPRRRGGRRPITETREETIRRLLDPELTLHEAAAVLNLSKATVRRYTDQGKLLCLRTNGGQRRFRLSVLLAFLDRRGPNGET